MEDMDIIIYNELDTAKIVGFKKLYTYLLNDDFKSAEVKKIDHNLYRAKLNRSDRILFSIFQYQSKKYILLLEYLKSHNYQGSRFLNKHSVIDDDLIPTVQHVDELESEQMIYINPKNPQFVCLNKFISFDDVQQHIYQQNLPLILIGSAGSGKTAILLEKIKKLEGRILYVTLSSFLVKNSHELYYSHQYHHANQEVDFFSFNEFIESILVPKKKAIHFDIFYQWYIRHYKNKDFNAHTVYEEFKGVITGSSIQSAYLDKKQYLSLGVKQSIFSTEQREKIYDIFEHYLRFLANEPYYDSNILSFEYLEKIQPCYDFVVIDEVQDITAIQLYLILKTLTQQGQFLLCGDANQIVHPNFFSWAKVKSLFYQDEQLHQNENITQILHHNYRNSQRVTEISNRILLLKNARFGSIDKESHYLVDSNADINGGVYFLKDRNEILAELDNKTSISTQFAVVVMHDEQKQAAQRFFKTPLIFSIQEAKGLEYQNIILYNFVSNESQSFNEICRDVRGEDLKKDFIFSRNKDKTDKSLEIYKFYINALYVGLTRAVVNLYWVEQKDQHAIFNLLGLEKASDYLDLAEQKSSLQDWQREAQKLELQGKKEQADRIRKEILKEKTANWDILTGESLQSLVHQALYTEKEDKKAKLSLFEYAIVYKNKRYLFELDRKGFKPAIAVLDRKNSQMLKAVQGIEQKYYLPYTVKNPTALMKKIEQFGINFRNEFNQTPLMASAWVGNIDLFKKLLADGADVYAFDNEYQTMLHIALSKACQSEKYNKSFFAEFYPLLKLESLILQVDHKLFKIEPNQAEYLIFHSIFALFMKKIHMLWVVQSKAIHTALLVEWFKYLPDHVMTETRKKQSYLSSILSKNERDSRNKYGKKLFLRIEHGQYMFNPDLLVKVNDEWYKIYDLLNIREIDYNEYRPDKEDQNVLHEAWYQDFIARIDKSFNKKMNYLFDILNINRQADIKGLNE